MRFFFSGNTSFLYVDVKNLPYLFFYLLPNALRYKKNGILNIFKPQNDNFWFVYASHVHLVNKDAQTWGQCEEGHTSNFGQLLVFRLNDENVFVTSLKFLFQIE